MTWSPAITRQDFQRRDGDTNPATKPSTHKCPWCQRCRDREGVESEGWSTNDWPNVNYLKLETRLIGKHQLCMTYSTIHAKPYNTSQVCQTLLKGLGTQTVAHYLWCQPLRRLRKEACWKPRLLRPV